MSYTFLIHYTNMYTVYIHVYISTLIKILPKKRNNLGNYGHDK